MVSYTGLAGILRSAPDSHVRLFAAVAACFVVSWAYFYGLQFVQPHLPGTDAYYHIKVAALIGERGILREFPWAQQSLWKDHYYDKDFGYHLFLVPFTGADLIYGAKLAAVTGAALIFTSLYLVLRLGGIRLAWLWPLLLIAAGGYFGWRMNTARPQVLSIVLSLWGLFFILRRQALATAVIGVIYALSYTAPFVLIIYAAIHAVANWLVHRRVELRILAWASAGVALGWLLHPHFPNNFVAVKLQIFGVLANAWGMSGPDLFLAGELKPAPLGKFLGRQAAVLGALGVAATAYLYARRDTQPARPPSVAILTLLAIALAFGIMSLAGKRFVEYAVPFSIWLTAQLLTEALQARQPSPARGRLYVALALAALIPLAVRSHLDNRENYSRMKASSVAPAAAWLQAHTEPGEVIFTCDWDDAPELFFYNDYNHYLVFLDPNYLYRWNPQRWQAWFDAANGHDLDPFTTITREFRARFGYCTKDFRKLLHKIGRNPQVQIRTGTDDAYIFEILPSALDEPRR